MTSYRFVRAFALGTLLAAVVAPAALAQAPAQREFGLRLGGALAQLRGDDDVFGDDHTDWKAGLAVGAFARFPVTTQFAVQPELLFTQEGGSIEEAFTDEGADVRFETDLNVSYLQLPVLLAYQPALRSRVQPIIYAGPYLGYAVRRSIDVDVEGADEADFGFSVDADEVFEQVNYGALLGFDLGFPVAGRRVTAGLRYDLGLANVFKNDAVLFDEDFLDEDSDVVVPELEARTSTFSASVTVSI